jgi:hypothetical protein
MKNLFFGLLLVCSQAFAAELHLSGGESVVIQPNTSTKVTCGGAGSNIGSTNCSSTIQAVATAFNTCTRKFSSGCVDAVYTAANIPMECRAEAFGKCYEQCNVVHSSGCSSACSEAIHKK